MTRMAILGGLALLSCMCNVTMASDVDLQKEKAETSDIPVLEGPYFGQTTPGDTAVVFAPGIVTTDDHEHSPLRFSARGTEVFWAVIPIDTSYKSTGGSPYMINDQKIWHSKIADGQWTKPAVIDLTKAGGGSAPAFSASGDVFYFKTRRLDADPDMVPRRSQLWKVSYRDGKWGQPAHENKLIPIPDRTGFMAFCFAESGNLYFDRGGPDETGKWNIDIYFSEFHEDGYLAPVKMGSGINDGEVSWCPCVAPDESYIIYSSHRDGEFGRGDLYINFKNENGNWSNPINMGRRVNTEMQERFPSVSPDGKYLFFTRNLPETFSDYFWVDAKIIEDLRQTMK